MSRNATISRKTAETDIQVQLELDGTGTSDVQTGLPFVDHMLTLFAKHGFFDLMVRVDGDLEIDAHHSMEDLGLVLGSAISQAVGDKRGIRRYGSFLLPMDETLARVVLDLSGRPYLVYEATFPEGYMLSGIDVGLFREFFRALSTTAGMNLHIDILRGTDVHHKLEAIHKGFARALDMATQIDPRETGIPSTKGTLV